MSIYDELEYPEHFHGTLEMVRCAFPEGVPTEYYLPFLRALGSKMSFRALATFVAPIMKYPDYVVQNDAVKALDVSDDDPGLIEVMEKLQQCGYTEWLDEE